MHSFEYFCDEINGNLFNKINDFLYNEGGFIYIRYLIKQKTISKERIQKIVFEKFPSNKNDIFFSFFENWIVLTIVQK